MTKKIKYLLILFKSAPTDGEEGIRNFYDQFTRNAYWDQAGAYYRDCIDKKTRVVAKTVGEGQLSQSLIIMALKGSFPGIDLGKNKISYEAFSVPGQGEVGAIAAVF